MKHRVFTLASAVSLLLCVATVVLWVRSYNKFDDLDRFTTSLTPTDFTQDCIRLGSSKGRFIFTWRDIIWPASSSGYAYVTANWGRDNGVHFTHKPPIDFDQARPKMSND